MQEEEENEDWGEGVERKKNETEEAGSEGAGEKEAQEEEMGGRTRS